MSGRLAKGCAASCLRISTHALVHRRRQYSATALRLPSHRSLPFLLRSFIYTSDSAVDFIVRARQYVTCTLQIALKILHDPGEQVWGGVCVTPQRSARRTQLLGASKPQNGRSAVNDARKYTFLFSRYPAEDARPPTNNDELRERLAEMRQKKGQKTSES